jgi:hypothetical protein
MAFLKPLMGLRVGMDGGGFSLISSMNHPSAASKSLLNHADLASLPLFACSFGRNEEDSADPE